jgi:hypothetical protein
MDIGTLLLLALVLACPLTMFWMMRGHGKRIGTAHPHKKDPNVGRTPPAGDRTEELERHEPPYTKAGGMVAPKFGSAGSGGAEYERGPEMHDR